MEPLRPNQRQALIDLGADPADVAEYEQLLSDMFTEDPDIAPAPGPVSFGTGNPKRQRLDALSKKLFPSGIKQREGEGEP